MKKWISFFMMCCILMGCQTSKRNIPLTPKRQISYLEVKSQKQIRSLLGKPYTIRQEEPYQLWTYRKKNCATLVYFGEDNVSTYAETRGKCDQVIAKLR